PPAPRSAVADTASTEPWHTVHLLDTDSSVTKSHLGRNTGEPWGSRDGRGVVGVAQLRIVGRRLPGAQWSGRSAIHAGLQCGSEVLDLVDGDEGEAVFNLELDVVAGADGDIDFRGPCVFGRRGERFIYLSWGEVGEDGLFAMFRRLKLHLTPLVEQ